MRRKRSVLLFAAMSLALHLAWVVWMPAGTRPAAPEEKWVELSLEEPAPSPAAAAGEDDARREMVESEAAKPAGALRTPPSASEAAHANESRAAQQLAAAKRMPPRAADVAPPTAAEAMPPRAADAAPPTAAERARSIDVPAASSEAAELAPSAQPVAPPSTPRTPPTLSPRAAALSVDAFALGPTFRCAAPGTAERDPGQNECAAGLDKDQAAQAALQRDLKRVAETVPHLKTRDAPELRRRSDGSYAYDGHVFEALVRPDGQVVFTDTAAKTQLAASLTPLKVVADVNDLVEHNMLGRELYSAEKQWFLEQTRELRLQLSTAARRQELLAANRALERTLQDVLGDRALSTPKKHEAVFLIWQDCGEDAQQKAHRRAVEAFVRRYMPRDSELGFGVEELRTINAGRQQLQAFEPYAGS